MTDKDYDYIAKLEKAIAEKYGEKAIKNPKSFWTKEKEERYLADLKEFYSRNQGEEEYQKERRGSVLISTKFLENRQERTCPVCGMYSFDRRDDMYMNKFQCCFNCYVQYVEGREERWKTGWRPER